MKSQSFLSKIVFAYKDFLSSSSIIHDGKLHLHSVKRLITVCRGLIYIKIRCKQESEHWHSKLWWVIYTEHFKWIIMHNPGWKFQINLENENRILNWMQHSSTEITFLFLRHGSDLFSLFLSLLLLRFCPKQLKI